MTGGYKYLGSVLGVLIMKVKTKSITFIKSKNHVVHGERLRGHSLTYGVPNQPVRIR
jgi:hypothetical protein